MPPPPSSLQGLHPSLYSSTGYLKKQPLPLLFLFPTLRKPTCVIYHISFPSYHVSSGIMSLAPSLGPAPLTWSSY